MLGFNIVDMGNYNFRCVLGDEIYFDFSVTQLDMFGYDHFFSYLRESIGADIKNVSDNKQTGELVSVKYLKPDDEVWILVRNGIRGELFAKNLGG